VRGLDALATFVALLLVAAPGIRHSYRHNSVAVQI